MREVFVFASLAVMTASVLGMDNTLPADVNGAVQQPITNLGELVNAPEKRRIRVVEKIWKLLNVRRKGVYDIFKWDSLWGNELLIDFIKSQPPTVVRKFFSNIKENFNQKDQIIDNFFGAEQSIKELPDLIKTLTKEQVEDVINTSAVCSKTIEGTNLVDSKTILNLLFHSKNKIPVSEEQNQKMCDNVYDGVSCFLEVLCAEYPLHNACSNGYENIVKYLIRYGADINKENGWKKTPLFAACTSGNKSLVKYLVEEHGADINKQDEYGETPLFDACESGHENIVKYLVEHGADVNKANNFGETPLFDACGSGNENLVKYLVEEHRADVNKEEDFGRTPLFAACGSGNKSLVKYLVEERGAAVNKKDEDGKTPLFEACEKGHLDIVKYLVEERGAAVEQEGKEGDTLLFAAIRSFNADLVKCLKDHGADVNKKNKEGVTPLKYIMQRCWLLDSDKMTKLESTIEMLVECGADVNETYRNGGSRYSLLSYSLGVLFNPINLVKALVEKYNANINVLCIGAPYFGGIIVQELDGTPLDIAEKIAFTEIVEYLKGKGAKRAKDLSDAEINFSEEIVESSKGKGAKRAKDLLKAWLEADSDSSDSESD